MINDVWNRIPENLQSSLKKTLLGYVIWIVLSIAGWYYLPEEWKWVAYGPLVFMVLAVGITAFIIVSGKNTPKTIQIAVIKGKQITSCQFCPMHDAIENPVSPRFPIIKCRETAKTCYNAMKIQRWCPYAKR